MRVGGAGGVTGSAISEPLRPVDFRSPVGRFRLAKGRTTVVSGSAARSAAGTPSANAASSASSYSSGSVRGGPPDAHAVERPERPEPVTARVRPPVAELGRDPSPRRGRAMDASVGADEEDGLRREPERGEPGGERLREAAAHRRDEATPRARSTCRRGSARSARCGTRRRKLDDEDAWGLRAGTADPRPRDRRPSDRRSGAGRRRPGVRRHRLDDGTGGRLLGYRPGEIDFPMNDERRDLLARVGLVGCDRRSHRPLARHSRRSLTAPSLSPGAWEISHAPAVRALAAANGSGTPLGARWFQQDRR